MMLTIKYRLVRVNPGMGVASHRFGGGQANGENDECVQHLHVPDDVWVPVESTVANYVPICDL